MSNGHHLRVGRNSGGLRTTTTTLSAKRIVVHLFAVWILLSSLTTSSSLLFSLALGEEEFPETIALRAGVLIAAPFATGDEDAASNEDFGGYQPDLFRRLQQFALEDGVDLQVNMTYGLQLYGPALDLVANDCNTTVNPNSQEDCNRYDLIIGDYYVNPDRSIRVDFTPPFLRTGMSTIKFVDKQEGTEDYTTLKEATAAKQPICVPEGTFIKQVAMAKHPTGAFVSCENADVCIRDYLKKELCVLYVEDELQLRYRAANDASLQVTGESFNTQFLVWPMNYAVNSTVRTLLKRWMYAAVSNATTDALYFQYFQKALCPIGTAGDNCELPCHPIHGQADDRGRCVCISTKYRGDDCSIVVEEDINLIPSSLKLIGNIMFGVNGFVVFLCLVWLVLKSDTPQVKVSQPYFLALVLFGCLVSSSTILVLGVEDSGDGPVKACMAIPWLYSMGFSVTFGTLFAKIRRVYLIFTKAAGMRRGAVTWQETACVTAVVLAIDVILLMLWTFVDPLDWTRDVIVADKFGDPLESRGYCRGWATFGSLIIGFHVVLLAIASFMCYVARDIPGEFSESKYIAMAMISNFQILLIGLPVLVLVGSEPGTSYFVRSAMIWMNDLAVVLLIFGNLVYSVHFSTKHRDEQGRVKDVKTMVNSAMSKFSQTNRHQSTNSELLSNVSGLDNNDYKSEVTPHTRSDFEVIPEGENEDASESLRQLSQKFANYEEGEDYKQEERAIVDDDEYNSREAEGVWSSPKPPAAKKIAPVQESAPPQPQPPAPTTAEGVQGGGDTEDIDERITAIQEKVARVQASRRERAAQARARVVTSNNPTTAATATLPPPPVESPTDSANNKDRLARAADARAEVLANMGAKVEQPPALSSSSQQSDVPQNDTDKHKVLLSKLSGASNSSDDYEEEVLSPGEALREKVAAGEVKPRSAKGNNVWW